MPPRNADQNLLVGFLAIQLNFITREQFLTGMNTWVTDKSRPLAEVLLEQGALKPDVRPLLDALAAKHLSMHDNDPEKSIAALCAASPAPNQLRLIAKGNLDQTFAFLNGTDENDPDRTEADGRNLIGQRGHGGARFHVLRPHAKGGLGEVFVARDTEVNREVALKRIQPQHADNPDNRNRFLIEAEITGGLEHPGIVPVYGLGNYDDGRPFYAMRFIRGDSLKESVDRLHKAEGSIRGYDSVTFRQLLGRFIDVCNAIEYAHSRGVLHRDLKPGNIMLGKYGETLVVDWGLAKAKGREGRVALDGEATLRPSSGDDSSETQMGQVIGTVAYMSPEQAAGKVDELGIASDVYSLGATLYYVLTGRAPFIANHDGNILKCVQRGEFPRPRSINPGIPNSLEAICLRAMATDPKQRYGSPNDLAADIEHYMADEPVAALPDTLGDVLHRFSRRNRSLVMAIVAALLVVATVSTAASFFVNEQRKVNAKLASDNGMLAMESGKLAENNAKLFESEREAKEKEQAANDRISRELRTANALRLAAQSTSLRELYPQRAGLLAIAAANETRLRGEPVLPIVHQSLLDSANYLSGTPLLTSFKSSTADFTSPTVAVSGNGRWLVIRYQYEVEVRDLLADGTDSLPRVLPLPDAMILSTAISADGNWLLIAGTSVDSTSCLIHVWDLRGPVQTPRAIQVAKRSIRRLTIGNNGKWALLVPGVPQAASQLIDLASPNSPVIEFMARTAALSNDGTLLALENLDGSVRITDLGQMSPLDNTRNLGLGGGTPWELRFSPDNRWLARELNADGGFQLWNLTAETPRPRTLPGVEGRIGQFAFSNSSRTLAVSSFYRDTRQVDTRVRLWDLNDAELGTELKPFFWDLDQLFDLRFSPDDTWLAAQGADRSVAVWRMADATRVILRGHDADVSSMAFAPSDDSLFTIARGEPPREWRLLGNEAVNLQERLGVAPGTFRRRTSFRPDGQQLATAGSPKAGKSNRIELHDPRVSRKSSRHIPLSQSQAPYLVKYSPDSKLLAAALSDRTLCVWDEAAIALTVDSAARITSTVKELTENRSRNETPEPANSFRPSHLWRLDAAVRDMLFHPDGSRIIVELDKGRLSLFDLRAPETPPISLQVAEPSPFATEHLSVTADGRWLIYNHLSISIWDLTASDISGSVRRLPIDEKVPHTSPIATPDSQRLLVGISGDIRQWDLRAAQFSNGGDVVASLTGQVRSLAISPNGRWIAASADLRDQQASEYLIWLVDLENAAPGSRPAQLRGHERGIDVLSFSPNGRWLATGSYDHTIRLWDLTMPNPAIEPLVLRGNDPVVYAIFDPSGDRLYSFEMGEPRSWDIDVESLVGRIVAGVGRVLSREEQATYRVNDPWLESFANEFVQLRAVVDRGSRLTNVLPDKLSVTDVRKWRDDARAVLLARAEGDSKSRPATIQTLIAAIENLIALSDGILVMVDTDLESLALTEQLSPEEFRRLLIRFYARLQAGQFGGASDTLAVVKKRSMHDPERLFELATVFGSTASTWGKEPINRQRWQEDCLSALRAALQAGFSANSPRLAKAELRPVHKLPAFHNLLTEFKRQDPFPIGSLAFAEPDQAFPKITASHTSPVDKLNHANDGIVEFRWTPHNRWTAYFSSTPTDWLQIEFEQETRISKVDLAIYDESPGSGFHDPNGGGVRTPERFEIQYLVGEEWRPVVESSRSPEAPTGGKWNEVRFEPVTAKKIRVVFTHQGNYKSGVTEMLVWP